MARAFWPRRYAHLLTMQHAADPTPSKPKPCASWDDAALVQALRDGSEPAFAEIYRRYGFGLIEQAYRKAGSREAAEEIVQDLFAALWHKRDGVEIQKLPEYLGTAVKYRVINLIKTRLTHADYLAYCRTQPLHADHRTEQELAATDLAGALRRSLTRLPAHTREIFRLSRLEHQSVPEIAGRLKLSPKAVEYHITRALKQLRVSLKDFLVVLALLMLR